MSKKDFLGYLIKHGQAFAIGFLLVISLSISMVVLLLVVFAVSFLNKLFH